MVDNGHRTNVEEIRKTLPIASKEILIQHSLSEDCKNNGPTFKNNSLITYADDSKTYYVVGTAECMALYSKCKPNFVCTILMENVSKFLNHTNFLVNVLGSLPFINIFGNWSFSFSSLLRFTFESGPKSLR